MTRLAFISVNCCLKSSVSPVILFTLQMQIKYGFSIPKYAFLSGPSYCSDSRAHLCKFCENYECNECV
jgi:hypothetical protein